MDIRELLKQLREFVEEPDDFETQSEREMQKELEKEIDNQYLKDEKERNKYVIKFKMILENIKNKIDIHYIYIPLNHRFTIYFDNKITYDRFMASEKNSDNFNSCLKLDFDKNRTFEKLGKDEFGRRYLNFYVK